MEKTNGSESGSGERRGHGRMVKREFETLGHEMAIHEMQRRLEAMELELKGYRERFRGIGGPRMRGENRKPRSHNESRGEDLEHAWVVKVDIPEFNGKGGVECFLEWMQEVDRVLELMKLEGREVVELVASRLRGYASIWWDYVEKERNTKGKEEVQSWRKMKRLLRERFMPSYLNAFPNPKPYSSDHPNPLNTTKPPTPNTLPKTLSLPQAKDLSTHKLNANNFKHSPHQEIEPTITKSLSKHTLEILEGEGSSGRIEAERGILVRGGDAISTKEGKTEEAIGNLSILKCPPFLEKSKIGNKFELKEITCDHEFVVPNHEKLVISFVINLVPCVEEALEDRSDSSQAGGNYAGASLKFSSSLKHK